MVFQVSHIHKPQKVLILLQPSLNCSSIQLDFQDTVHSSSKMHTLDKCIAKSNLAREANVNLDKDMNATWVENAAKQNNRAYLAYRILEINGASTSNLQRGNYRRRR